MAGPTTWTDIAGCLKTTLTFSLLLLAPGYCLGFFLNLLAFRRKPTMEQLAWSVALSFAITPVAAVMLAKYGSLRLASSAALVSGAAAFVLALRQIVRTRPHISRTHTIAAIASLLWIAFVIGELIDAGAGNHLYLSVTVFDHALRTAFVDSVLRTGVPPANPLFLPGHAAPMRYYYFWYVLTAVAAQLARASARQAVIASVVWSGFGLAALVALYSRHLLGRTTSAPHLFGNRRPWSRVSIALGLLAVTGLDILPAIAKAILRLPADPDMDWWSPDQVTSWLGSVLWVPHHVAALICCLLGFLLIWTSKRFSRIQRALCAVVSGLAFASAFGLSTWVAIAFALVMLLWLLWVLAYERESRPRAAMLLASGILSVLALVPYLAELRAEPSGVVTLSSSGADSVASAGNLLRFGVRHIIDPDALLALPGFAKLAHTHPRIEDAIAGLILLLPGYALEFGFYAIALIAAFRHRTKLAEADRATLFLVLAGLLVSSFLHSTVVVNNDFGIRSILIAQFFLLLLAVRFCEGGFSQLTPRSRTATLMLLCLGVTGTLYQAVELRLYLPFQERLGRRPALGLAEHAAAVRRGFDEMDQRIPTNAVIQFDTTQRGDYFLYAEILQARRQMAMALPVCTAAFGGDPYACTGLQRGVAQIFPHPAYPASSEARPPDAASARAVCDRLKIDYLIATRWDPVWADPAGWVWHLPAAVDTPDMKVLACASPMR